MKKEILIEYEIKEMRVRVFGENFVKNNKDNFKLIINDKEYELMNFYEISNYHNQILKIKIKFYLF